MIKTTTTISHFKPSTTDFCDDWCREHYHDGKLTKIERVHYTPTGRRVWNPVYGEVNQHYVSFKTIWKRGWHHIKGARKTARARKAA